MPLRPECSLATPVVANVKPPITEQWRQKKMPVALDGTAARGGEDPSIWAEISSSGACRESGSSSEVLLVANSARAPTGTKPAWQTIAKASSQTVH